MKKKEAKELREQKFQPNLLLNLEKKLDQQLKLEQKEKAKMQLELHAEIQKTNYLQEEIKNISKKYQFRIDELKAENQHLNAQIARNSQHFCDQDERDHEIDTQITILQNQKFRAKNQELVNLIESIYYQKSDIEENNRKLTEKEHIFEITLKQIRKSYEELKQANIENNQKNEEIISELTQEKEKLVAQINDNKKKRKQLKKKLEGIQKLAMEQQNESSNKYERQIHSHKTTIEELEQIKYSQQTKIHSKQAEIDQKSSYIDQLQLQINQNNSKLKQRTQQNHIYSCKMDKMVTQIKKLQKQKLDLEQKLTESMDETTKMVEDKIEGMRIQMFQEFMTMLKEKDQERCYKTLEKYMSDMSFKNSKSEVLLNTNKNMNQQHFFDKFKLENQLSNYQIEIVNVRKQLESLNKKNQEMKRQIDQMQMTIGHKDRELNEAKLKIDKGQSDKNRQIISLRNQLGGLKSVQTEKLEIIRDRNQYEEAINMKVTFYEKKIKENLQNLDRKDQLINQLKVTRFQNDEKIKQQDAILKKQADENEHLKRYRQEVGRKDELVRDYRVRLERIKSENEELTKEVDHQKKERTRVEKQIESKQMQLMVLKNKFATEKEQIDQSQQSEKQDAKIRELKNSYDQKIKKCKKQQAEYYSSLSHLKQAIMSKVDHLLLKSIHPKRKAGEYEGAKMLGLKSSELEDFLDPENGFRKNIATDLQELWDSGNYSSFVQKFIDFMKEDQ